MEPVLDEFKMPHPMFAEATSIEHFVELLRSYHQDLMVTRPPEQRYKFQDCRIRFDYHPKDDPDYNCETAWGEYYLRMTFDGVPREKDYFETIKNDFPFFDAMSASGNYAHDALCGSEVHETSIYIESFPKIHAEFMKLQDLNEKHDEHVRKVDAQVKAACETDTQMAKVQRELTSHRVAIYLLEADEKAAMARITEDVKTNNPEPYAAERAALLQTFADR
jgi:hypothetical protein